MSQRRRDRAAAEDGLSLIPIMNLVCLLIPFLLYTASFVLYAVVPATMPRIAPRPPRDETRTTEERPVLALTITDEGFLLLSPSGAVPTTCGQADEGRGRLPLRADAAACVDRAGYPSPAERAERGARRLGPPTCAYDFASLGRCVAELKQEDPSGDRIVILGEPRVGYDVLIRTMDVARGTDDEPLFSEVVLGSGVS